MKKHNILALIPARGGSKGIPGKNIKELAGKPLIAYTIEAATHCDSITKVVVSTDSKEIADVAAQYGAEIPCLRPAELASDTAKTMDAVWHMLEVLKEQGQTYDYLVLLQPTSPLRSSKDIEEALRLALDSGKDVVAVSRVNDHPILMRTMDENQNVTPLLQQNSTVRRQDMPEYYRVNGSIYVNHLKCFTKDTSFNDNPVGYIMPRERSVDIDETLDFILAEYYLTKKSV